MPLGERIKGGFLVPEVHCHQPCMLSLSELNSLLWWNSSFPPRFLCGPPQIEHKAPLLRDDVIEANFYSGTLANSYEMDVLDLHYHFRFSLQHRTNDGVHWNALAHRWLTCLLLKHIAQAWGVTLPLPQAAVPVEEKNMVPGKCILTHLRTLSFKTLRLTEPPKSLKNTQQRPDFFILFLFIPSQFWRISPPAPFVTPTWAILQNVS